MEEERGGSRGKGRGGEGRRTYLLPALVVKPLVTHHFRDGAPERRGRGSITDTKNEPLWERHPSLGKYLNGQGSPAMPTADC